ncbi:hypothetical protein OGAPHI_006988 [Ogataea philodendri]|uniref:PABS domain-containing protein n=1 Tax=Ogataea philodendri TaxID=1378263 RepID=A0A9P8NWB9_9ASCO|nr:uncharacterized protein OGAPHI_006988 [Ogataea philodendri]KAH3660402.1 hypothetical protein OGAPHI_006988 [Ogataea philodendri]
MELSHPLIKDGWFREESEEFFPGQAMRLRVEKILHAERSKFQDVLVFKSTDFGNVLVLDGIIQVTERDEFAYQEMITHVPMFAHPSPKKVLVIGGGDGGVLREVLKHDCVEKATLVEIDESVINLSRKYLPKMSHALDHEKVQVVLADGFEFLKNTAAKHESEKYDIIITDSSDPEGPAEAFFQKQYFELLYNALNANGMVISMASENIWLNIDKLKTLKDICSQVFSVTECCYCTIPTYTSGQIALMCCSKNPQLKVSVPHRHESRDRESELFRYYNNAIHGASFVLPRWAADKLN